MFATCSLFPAENAASKAGISKHILAILSERSKAARLQKAETKNKMNEHVWHLLDWSSRPTWREPKKYRGNFRDTCGLVALIGGYMRYVQGKTVTHG